MREKLKALMQGLQQRGQEYTGPGTIRGHNNVGVEVLMKIQYSSAQIDTLYISFQIYLFWRSRSRDGSKKHYDVSHAIQFSFIYLALSTSSIFCCSEIIFCIH